MLPITYMEEIIIIAAALAPLPCYVKLCGNCVRLLRGVGASLEEGLAYAALLLAQLAAPFDAATAAEALNLAGDEERARGCLAALTRLGLLQLRGCVGAGDCSQAWAMHVCVRDAVCSLAEELGIRHLAAK